MSDPDFDFIVIGGGSAGYAGASAAAQLGLKTAVVEGGQEVGGLCILRGCMPSKTLLESAHRAESIRRASEFGLRAQYLGADGTAIRARKRRLIAEFASHRKQQLESGAFEFIRGRARFVDPHTIEVRLLDGASRRLHARAFLIATGSRLHFVNLPGLAEAAPWTSDDLLDSDHIPQSVVILGGGAIGLETASYYNGLGSTVSVIQRSARVLKEMDADVTDSLNQALERRGVVIFRQTEITRLGRDGASKQVSFLHRGKRRVLEAEEIIYALGRQPALEGMDLDRAGVVIRGGAIAAEPTQQCGAAHLFAAGDACGPHEVVHIAIQQAEIAARNAARHLGRLEGPLETVDYRLKLFVVFTHPEVAAAGLTEAECADQRIAVRVARHPFSDLGKSLIHGEAEGFVKLIAEHESGRLLGAACVGLNASELIHEVVVAMHFRATATELLRVPHYHPTLGEIWTYPAEELARPPR